MAATSRRKLIVGRERNGEGKLLYSFATEGKEPRDGFVTSLEIFERTQRVPLMRQNWRWMSACMDQTMWQSQDLESCPRFLMRCLISFWYVTSEKDVNSLGATLLLYPRLNGEVPSWANGKDYDTFIRGRF